MSGDGDLENFVLSIIRQWWASRYSERHGIVTSYDPKKYLAKVTFMPEGQESGWLPIETGHVGQGYGIAIGLQPGQGGQLQTGSSYKGGAANSNASPEQGDQVIVRFQEGDFEGGKIVQRVHSEQDTPPPAQSGEMLFWTKFQKSGGPTPDAASGGQGGTGQQIYFKNDGSLTFTDGNGGSLVFDGQGNMTLNCKNGTINMTGNRSLTINGTDGVSIGKDKSVSIGGGRTDGVKKGWRATALGGVWSWLTSGGDMTD